MSANGRAGARFETELVEYAREHGFPGAHRLHMGGSKDAGDIWLGVPWVVEAKNEKVRDVPGALKEAEKEAKAAGCSRYVAVHKYRNHTIDNAVVSMPWWLFLEVVGEAQWRP